MPDFAGLARLLEYPGPDFPDLVRAVVDARVSEDLDAFARAAGSLSPEEAQEVYTRAFDWNPDTTLDISWHLFGENYERGEFLVRMRRYLRDYGISATRELPDHLPLVLAVLERMPEGEASVFIHESVSPAVGKIAGALERESSPYVHLLREIERELAARALAGIIREASHA